MSKRDRLNKIKRVRAIRDELLTSDNNGRMEFLISSLPNVEYVCYFDRWEEKTTVHLYGGYVYHRYGKTCLIESGLLAYKKWLQNGAK